MDDTKPKADFKTALRFLEVFNCYRDAYGEYTPPAEDAPEGEKERGSSTTSHLYLGDMRMAYHLQGLNPKSVGLYPLLPGGTDCVWCAIDIDEYPVDFVKLHKLISGMGAPFYIFRSKSGGAHLFLFLETYTKAVVLRAFMSRWVDALSLGKVELFPKQDKVARSKGEYGNYINCPYFNGTRCCVDVEGNDIPLQVFLDTVKRVPFNTLEWPKATKPNAEDNNRFVLPDEIPESGGPYNGRNNTLYRYACALQSKGYEDDDIDEFVNEANEQRCQPPMEQRRVDALLASAKRHPKGTPRDAWIDNINQRHAFVTEGGKSTILNTEDYDYGMKMRWLTRSTPADFKYQYCTAAIGKMDLGVAWLRSPHRRAYRGVTFVPGVETPGWYNLWRGFSVEARPHEQGACGWMLFRELMRDVICAGSFDHYDWLIKKIARMYQVPAEAGEVAIAMRGGKGAGKGFFFNALASCMKEHSMRITNSEHVIGRFNAHIQDKVLVFLDEAFFAGDRKHEAVLKALITEPVIAIEGKYRAVVQAANYAHTFIGANADWMVPASLDERRFFVLNVSDKHLQDYAFFEAMQKQLDEGGLQNFLWDMQHMDLTGFNHRDCPNTQGLLDQKMQGLNVQQRWWVESLIAGYIKIPDEPADEAYWRTKIPKDDVYMGYLMRARELNERHPLDKIQLGMFLHDILKSLNGPVVTRRNRWPKRCIARKETWRQNPHDISAGDEHVEVDVEGYEMPELKDARTALEAALKQKMSEYWGAQDGT